MSTLGNMKNMYQLQKKAKKIKEKLKNIHIEAEEDGVKITVTGEQEVIKVEISDEATQDKEKLEKTILKVLQKGLKKAQEVAAVNMQEIMGSMGLGMPGSE